MTDGLGRWGSRCASCGHRRNAHTYAGASCVLCYCPRYYPPWWAALKNWIVRRWRGD